MGNVILGMAISLDGFVHDKNGSVARLYPDFDAMHELETLKESMEQTGAVVMGKHAYEMANGDFTGYEYQTPIFVVTHHPPQTPAKGQNDHLQIHFIGDGVESAVRQAKAAAGDKNVTIVGGANVFQQCLNAGLVDELHINMMPVLFGEGLPLFEHLEKIKLEIIKTMPFLTGTEIRYRVFPK